MVWAAFGAELGRQVRCAEDVVVEVVLLTARGEGRVPQRRPAVRVADIVDDQAGMRLVVIDRCALVASAERRQQDASDDRRDTPTKHALSVCEQRVVARSV
jgi:hypothetical protein